MATLRQAATNPCTSCRHSFLHATNCTAAAPGSPISTSKPYQQKRSPVTFNWPADSGDN